MPMVEIDEQVAREAQAATALLDGLYRHPKLGLQFKRLLKASNPNLSIPEVDVSQPIIDTVGRGFKEMQERFAKQDEELKKLRSERQDEKDEATFWKTFDKVVADNEITDTGRDDLIKIMKERKIADPEVAAAYLLRTKGAEPMAPSGFRPSKWNFFTGEKGDDKLERLMKDPELFLEEEGEAVFREMRGKAA